MTELKNVGVQIEGCLRSADNAERAIEDAKEALKLLAVDAGASIRAAVDTFNGVTTGSYLYEVDSVSVFLAFEAGKRRPSVRLALGTFRYRTTGHQMHYRDAWGVHQASLTCQLRSYLLETQYWLRSCTLLLSIPDDYDMMNADPDA